VTSVKTGTDGGIVSLTRLMAWMDERAIGTGPLEDVRPLGGGTQNVLLQFARDGREYVLRRGPEHKRANSDETIRREARVLGALAATDVPHPRLVIACDDLDVLGASFYLMESVDGFNPTVEVPPLHAADVEVQRAMGLAVVDGVLALARIEPGAVGLADLGRPDGWLERQVSRWNRLLDSYREIDSYPHGSLPLVEEVGRWLARHRPRATRIGLIHGDFHIANMLVRRDRGALAAIVDWELATQGDPLLDLAHLLATWPRGGASIFALPAELDGLPSVGDLVDHYANHTDRDLADLVWFRALACYRLAIIIEGTYARSLVGKAPTDIGELSHTRAIALLEHALQTTG
jgi:aminoglycoside phosphotransferase (APT) family kinase protein